MSFNFPIVYISSLKSGNKNMYIIILLFIGSLNSRIYHGNGKIFFVLVPKKQVVSTNKNIVR